MSVRGVRARGRSGGWEARGCPGPVLMSEGRRALRPPPLVGPVAGAGVFVTAGAGVRAGRGREPLVALARARPRLSQPCW
ncbi:hypothetical protein EES47_04465 [Streptomyces sp. ADI98-12]|nr:hypothetical protein [Streptomyces sp. DSM 41037]RPK91650.1 hypothetical protein EES47_04465 [Streptomyces sp. ADI98-12]